MSLVALRSRHVCVCVCVLPDGTHVFFHRGRLDRLGNSVVPSSSSKDSNGKGVHVYFPQSAALGERRLFVPLEPVSLRCRGFLVRNSWARYVFSGIARVSSISIMVKL